MNFIERQKVQFLCYVLGDDFLPSKFQEKFFKWLDRIWFLWFQKHEHFGLYFRKIEVGETGIDSDGLGVDMTETFFYRSNSSGARVTLNLTEYEKKDARRGLLYIYFPSQTFRTANATEHNFLLEVRDFFRLQYRANPNVDLNKFTMTTLPKQIEEWRAELRRQAEAKERMEWSLLTENVDWINTGESKDYVVLRMLTPLALEYEHRKMHHCINTYVESLYGTDNDRCVYLLSVRHKDAISVPLFTVDLPVNIRDYTNRVDRDKVNTQIRCPRQFYGPCNTHRTSDSAPEFVAYTEILLSQVEAIIKRNSPWHVQRPPKDTDMTFQV